MYNLLFEYFKTKTGIDRPAFDRLSAYFVPKELGRQEFLVMEGDVCRYNYFVKEGCLRLYSINGEAQENTRYFAFKGKFGTALSSFIQEVPSREYVQSIGPSSVLAISRYDFYHLVDTSPAFNFIYRDILEMAYVTSQKRIYGLQGQTALERLKWLMEYQPDVLSMLSNKVVASYLGVTPYTLSRLKAEL